MQYHHLLLDHCKTLPLVVPCREALKYSTMTFRFARTDLDCNCDDTTQSSALCSPCVSRTEGCTLRRGVEPSETSAGSLSAHSCRVQAVWRRHRVTALESCPTQSFSLHKRQQGNVNLIHNHIITNKPKLIFHLTKRVFRTCK